MKTVRNILLGLVLFAGMSQSFAYETQVDVEFPQEIARKKYTCYAVDAHGKKYEGHGDSKAEAKKTAMEICHTFSKVPETCVPKKNCVKEH